MLMGEYMHSIDAKGRVILPADFRAELGDTFIVTKGLDGCLFIYAQSEWDQLSEKLRQLPLAKTEARAFVRFFFAGARQVELDKQGRFLVPATLRQHASLQYGARKRGSSTMKTLTQQFLPLRKPWRIWEYEVVNERGFSSYKRDAGRNSERNNN